MGMVKYLRNANNVQNKKKHIKFPELRKGDHVTVS